ncbi:hypothetical protein ACFW1M_16720 [Streptomyces inhibens]|uniref:hypothetical protein n=1 Tax=Streptomyces inhibens TaxID=2293571 RepID=UPI0036942E76
MIPRTFLPGAGLGTRRPPHQFRSRLQPWTGEDLGLSSHNSLSTWIWLEDHPRIHHVFVPVRACWLNLQEGRRRGPLVRRSHL